MPRKHAGGRSRSGRAAFELYKKLDKREEVWHGEGTIERSGSSAPVRRGFFTPVRALQTPFRRVKRAEYNTRKGNKPRRLRSVVETRRHFIAATLKAKEAHHV